VDKDHVYKSGHHTPLQKVKKDFILILNEIDDLSNGLTPPETRSFTNSNHDKHIYCDIEKFDGSRMCRKLAGP